MQEATIRVRPGFTHGVGRKYSGGDVFTVSAEDAVLLLAAFGDKLEVVNTVVAAAIPERPQAIGKSKRA